MPRTVSPVSALQQALQHALEAAGLQLPDGRVPGGVRPATDDDLEVFAMFAQPASSAGQALGRTHAYAVVLWCGALNAWLVYFDGQYGYQLRTHEGDVLAFMRDMRAHLLAEPARAPEAYRTRR